MDLSITELSRKDLNSVDTLMKENSSTLGFLPFEALTDYTRKGGIIGAKSLNDELLAYLLYSSYPAYFRIVHLCVSKRCRGNNIARELVDKLRSFATTQTLIKLHCRRDFPAHHMWPNLGFVPMDEKPGRSARRSSANTVVPHLGSRSTIGIIPSADHGRTHQCSYRCTSILRSF